VNAYDGGWADYARRRSEREAEPSPPSAATPKPARAPALPKPPRRDRELEEIESRITAQERLVERLEVELADDWTNVDTIAAHRRARDELTALLDRWETLVG
jgi:uncharacterized coiled-coil protein SlyX